MRFTQESLSDRLRRLQEDPANRDNPLLAEVELFAAQGVRLQRSQEKLIAISDTMQSQLAARSKELMQLNSQKDLFFSIIAHGLRGPLGSFEGMVGLLLGNYDRIDEARRLDLLDSLRQEGQHIQRLLENLLTWAGVQMGQLEFDLQRYPVDELIDEAVQSAATAAHAKGVALIRQESGLQLPCDRGAVVTVLRNLLNNAVKFTPRGGEVSVEADVAEGEIRIRVSDNGMGIAPEAASRLFELGWKRTGVGTENERGSGLGLILCAELMQRLGGSIELVSSAPGMGSTFLLRLPEGQG